MLLATAFSVEGLLMMKNMDENQENLPWWKDIDDNTEDNLPWWHYAHLSETTLAALAMKAPKLLRCRCGGAVSAARVSASGADDGPAYLYCDTCYRTEIENDRTKHIPIAEDVQSITIYDIVWNLQP